MTLRLVRLDCPSCGSAMHGQPYDVLFLCDHCGAGAVLGENGPEVVKSTALQPAAGRHAQVWLPGWFVAAEVAVSQRVSADGRRSPDWKQKQAYVIPAFELPLASLTRLARALVAAGPAYTEVPHEPVRGGVMALDDALTMVRHLVVGTEVGRPDMLSSVQVTIEPIEHRIVALPFEKDDKGLRCAISGLAVPAPG